MARTKRPGYYPKKFLARTAHYRDFQDQVRERIGGLQYQCFHEAAKQCKFVLHPFEEIETIYNLIGHHEDLWKHFKTSIPKKNIQDWDQAKDLLRAASSALDDKKKFESVVSLMHRFRYQKSLPYPNASMEEMFGLIGDGSMWPYFKSWAPERVEKWEALKKKLDSINKSPEFREIVYDLQEPFPNVKDYELVGQAYHLFGKNDAAAWERFKKLVPKRIKEWEAMKDFLIPAAEKFEEHDYRWLVQDLKGFAGPMGDKRNQMKTYRKGLKMYQKVGHFNDIWNAFVGHYTMQTSRIRREIQRPAPKAFGSHDVLQMILERLPFPSIYRLSCCCAWLNINVPLTFVSPFAQNVQKMCGRFDLDQHTGRFTIRSQNDETITIQPIARDSLEFNVNGEVFEIIHGKEDIANDLLDLSSNGQVKPNTKIWFSFREDLVINVFFQIIGEKPTKFLLRCKKA